MKRKTVLSIICAASVASILAGCGSRDNDNDRPVYDDYESTGNDSKWFSGNDKEKKSILTDPDDYEYGDSSAKKEEYAEDTRFDNASLMFEYEGRTYSSEEVDLEFVLTEVSDGGDQIKVVFDKCQYPLSGIDLGEVYTGNLMKISGGYAAMEGCYEYAIPFMDLWEDGSRHEDTFYLKFSFGSRDGREFALSEIGLLNDTLYMT